MTRSARVVLAVGLVTAAFVRLTAAFIDIGAQGSASTQFGARFFEYASASLITPLLALLAALLFASDSDEQRTDVVRAMQLVAVVMCGVITCVGTIAYTVAKLRRTSAGFFALDASISASLILSGIAAVIAGLTELAAPKWHEAPPTEVADA